MGSHEFEEKNEIGMVNGSEILEVISHQGPGGLLANYWKFCRNMLRRVYYLKFFNFSIFFFFNFSNLYRFPVNSHGV